MMNGKTETKNFPCRSCGKEIPVEVPVEELARKLFLSVFSGGLCEECVAKTAAEEEQRQQERRREEFIQSLPSRLATIGLPKKYAIDAPRVAFVADWIFENRRKHLVLSGQTGTGKSTSAGYIARKLTASSYAKIRYFSLRKLLAEWRIAKTADNQRAAENFIAELARLDVLIIDEFIDKASITASGQELLYELIDSAYNGSIRCRLWLLGNFYRGSIAEMFDDPYPVLRRFRESFTCGLIEQGTITKINF